VGSVSFWVASRIGVMVSVRSTLVLDSSAMVSGKSQEWDTFILNSYFIIRS
jgi:hypothetical protein